MEFGWIRSDFGLVKKENSWIVHRFGLIFTQSGSISKPDPT